MCFRIPEDLDTREVFECSSCRAADGLTAEQAVATFTMPLYAGWRNHDRFTKLNVMGLYQRFQSEARPK